MWRNVRDECFEKMLRCLAIRASGVRKGHFQGRPKFLSVDFKKLCGHLKLSKADKKA